jgi:hypothetical protein
VIEWFILERVKLIAGFVLVIAAIINLFGGALYTFTGESNKAITTPDNVPVDSSKDEATTQPSPPETAPHRTAGDGAISESNNAPEIAFKDTLWLAVGFWFGLFLLVMFVSQIIAAVMLLLSRSRKFVMWVGILSLPTEIIGIYFFSFNLLRNGFGILASILAIVGATLINEPQDASPTAEAP